MNCFEELCRENYGRIYKYIYALTGSREPAQDLIQDVFTVAYEKGDAFLTHPNPPAFLYKTARNLTYTYLKRNRLSDAEYPDEYVAGGDGDPYDVLMKDDDRRIDETVYAARVISSLDSEQQTLYAQRYIERRPINDIAFEHGVSEPAMRMRLVRLRREIRGIVKDLKLDEK